MYQKGYGYSEVKKHYPITKGNFYYLVRIFLLFGSNIKSLWHRMAR